MKRLLLLVAAAFALPASAVEYRSVDAPTVLYDAPSQRGVKLFVIKRDTPVEVVVSLEGWSKVRDAEGGLAWIEKKFLAEKRTLIVTADRAEVRQKPEESSPLAFEAEKNVALEYLEVVPGGWIKVRHRDGQIGFVRANQVWGNLSLNLTVIAAGAWGTALAIAFSGKHRVTLWTREDDVTQTMLAERENRRFFPGHRLPAALQIGTDFATSVAAADLLLFATPLVGFRPTLRRLREVKQIKPLIWVCKGMEAETARLPHQIVAEELGEQALCGALSGPSFAEEVAKGLPTAITLAANNADFGHRTALALHSHRLRIYANDDLPGVEVGGAVKNVMAIATGICDGLGLGLNARAALMTRGLAEIARLGVALGGHPNTFMGLAGMGDLILTCTGDLSRNRQVGLALAAGKKLSQILADLGHVAEGVGTAHEVARLAAQLGIEMPITQAVDAILYRDVPAADAVENLLSRDPKVEAD